MGPRVVAPALLCVFGIALRGHGSDEQATVRKAFQQARELESQGKLPEAFVAYLAVPGGEYAAVRVARPKAVEFLTRLDLDRVAKAQWPRAVLVRGDLLLATGDKERALECFRRVAAVISKRADQGWQQGFMPHDYYPVEPPRAERAYRPAQPFVLGPGSHRDNWLIRRFVALEGWEDAAQEFARIWQIHRALARPYVAPVRRYDPDTKEMVEEKRIFRPAGFNGRGLQFAIDYAYFLKRRGREQEALALLMEPLLVIDMDRNPNSAQQGEPVAKEAEINYPELRTPSLPGRHYSDWGASAGISRKEFIRLVYGALKAAGKESDLSKALKEQIEAGENRARRVLARVRLHQGRLEDALALELAYIKAGQFDEFSSAYRRALAYEDTKKVAEAAAEYEKALALAYVPPDVPDLDEEATQRLFLSSAPRQLLMRGLDPWTPGGRSQFLSQLLERLQRLYAALGETDRALDTMLRQLDVSPRLLARFDTLEQSARRFRSAGQETRFAEWATRQAAATRDLPAKANLYWLLGDHVHAAEAVGQAVSEKADRAFGYEQWKQRFRKAGKQKLRLLLQALVAANPSDARSRLELLDLEDRFEGNQVVHAFEALLEGGADHAFGRGKGDYNRSQFRNYFDLAYRLMRMYEKRGELDKLRALGLRIASGEKPFDMIRQCDLSQYRYRDSNSLPEDMNACLALAIQHADSSMFSTLEAALAQTPREPAKAQLARRKAGGWRPSAGADIEWANLPRGVRALACNENVLSLAVDGGYIYAGLPWGIAVYTHQGEPVVRVALATAALDVLSHYGLLWVATPQGLRRVKIGSWTVARLDVDHDLSERDRHRSSRNGAWSLAPDGHFIWIGTFRNIQRLDARSNRLRVFSQKELGVDSHGRWQRFVVEKDYVWASTGRVSSRYDRRTDTWTPVSYDEKPVGLIALAGDQLWGHVWLNNELRDRPCLIDRKTLAVTPVLIEKAPSVTDRCINGPFAYFGTLEGKPVLGPKRPRFVYDPEIRKLRPFPSRPDGTRRDFDSDLLPGLRTGFPWRRPDGTIVCYNDYTHRHELLAKFRFNTGHWLMARLPDGTLVLAGRRERSPRYECPPEDWPQAFETWDPEGGLYLISPDRKQVRRISSTLRTNVLPGDVVLDFVRRRAYNHWVCTNRGLAALSEDGAVLAHFTRADGLCANRVVAGAELRGRVYFATGWGDHGGGLMVYDPKTFTFTSRVQSDGLATDKLAGIEIEKDRLKLIYDVEYLRGAGGRYRHHPPGLLDPQADKVTSGGEPRITDQGNAHRATFVDKESRRSVPYLGGYVLSERQHQGWTYLCGTRGMVILRSRSRPPRLAVKALKPKVVLDPRIEQQAYATSLRIAIGSPADLASYLRDKNPYVRAKALAALRGHAPRSAQALLLIAAQLKHPNVRVRSSALYVLTRSDDDKAVLPALDACLQDPDQRIRTVATVELLRRGRVPDEAHLREVLRRKDCHGLPYDVSSTVGVKAGREHFYEEIARHATRNTLAVLMEFPQPSRDVSEKAFETFGQSLIKRPDCAEVLLTAYDPERYGRSRRAFAQTVFKHAGKPVLPVLHNALTDSDRVVRSNAARACGAIADASSIPRLIAALDLESGLSRASIVWALGELKAKEALPHLTTLYIDARNDEKRRRGSGFRMSQRAAAMQAQYDAISNLDAVGAEWGELNAATQPKPVDPRRNEELLAPRHILDAARKIGPAASQEFYRSLAGEKDVEGRLEAAARLAEGGESETERNLVILRNLLADTEVRVRISAAVSLLILGQDVVQRQLLEWLGSASQWEQRFALEQLARVKEPARLRFALSRIEAIAKDQTVRRETRRAAQRIVQTQVRQ